MGMNGNPQEFAIEFHLTEKLDDYWYGNLCFWIGGRRVGNFNEISTITISVSFLKDFIIKKPYRQFDNSPALSKEYLFYQLYKKFFLSESIKDQSYLELGNIREIFWLDEVGEYSFRDKIGMILIDEPELKRQRFIWQMLDNDSIFEYFIPLDHFEVIANEFVKTVDKEAAE